jgi:hypothetical protein
MALERRRLAGLMLVLATLAACSTAAPSGAPGASGPPGSSGVAVAPGQTGTDAGPGATRAPAPTDCRQRIEAARLDSAESLDAVIPCRFAPEGTAAAQAVLLAGGNDDVIWTAIWAYAPGATDPAPLRAYIASDTTSIRVIAAAGLVALGDASGFAVLAASASDTGPLMGSHPPISIRELVIGTFQRFVNADGAPGRWTTYEEYLTVGSRWAEWATANGSRVVFDKATGSWVLP